MNPASLLHCTTVQPGSAPAQQLLLFVHGILGTGANLRGIAQRFVQSRPSWAAALVDLRGHGRSPHFGPPHTLAACAEDLCALEQSLELPVAGIVGHSFGGKVALAYHARRPDLEHVALLDSAPFARPYGAGSAQTLAIIELLERAPERFDSRQAFVELVHAHGHSRAIGDWLAMNLERTPSGFRLRTELALIRALLEDYFAQDLWPVLEASRARMDVVIAGRSEVYGSQDIARLKLLAEASQGRVRTHVLPEAGHWVHVDDPEGVLAALTP